LSKGINEDCRRCVYLSFLTRRELVRNLPIDWAIPAKVACLRCVWDGQDGSHGRDADPRRAKQMSFRSLHDGRNQQSIQLQHEHGPEKHAGLPDIGHGLAPIRS